VTEIIIISTFQGQQVIDWWLHNFKWQICLVYSGRWTRRNWNMGL